jgi:hypothetical protein
MKRRCGLVLLLLVGLAGLGPGCSRRPVSVGSIASLCEALPGPGWSDVQFHPVDAATLAEAGITTAGLVRSGELRMEVYEIGTLDAVNRVADLFAATGDPVLIGGLLVVLVPAGPDDQEVVARLLEVGLRRHGPNRSANDLP